MTWFIFALICVLGWGFADLFYKRSSDADDRYSHLKIAVWVGLVMGVCAIALMPLSESGFNVHELLVNAVKYSPASLCYIISMVIGYAGLRYLELSIVSPVQNASGAFSAIFMLIYFLIVGRIESLSEEYGILDLIGTVLIVAGVIAIAFVEQRLAAEETKALGKDPNVERKYRYGALALLFPILYCIFDTIGTAADGIILDDETGLGLGEIDVIILYGLTFLLAGIICWIFLLIKTRKPYNPFKVKELKTKGIAALCEEFGQVFYVYAMAQNPVLAAPMVASYCIISVILSRIFIKEKLTTGQYICVILVILGIVALGISEGLAS
ncbi:MAG: DMT family transporter [Lachnospiraceae bacterium]|nr:DMT family transporter [Lachnospiraceae bacterium]MBR6350622.1 DMT family transporter [Lachnospiraceae bacterium]